MTKFMTQDGPWDTYTLFSAMHRHFTDVLMPVLGLLDADKDATRALLERCIADVRETRTWKGHGNGRVTVEEHLRAMHSMIDVLRILSPHFADAAAAIASIQQHVTCIESACTTGLADLSVEFHACLVFMRALEQLRTCYTRLMPGSSGEITEIIEAIRKMMRPEQQILCHMVLKGRNYMFHGADMHRSLALLQCTCAVAMILRFLLLQLDPASTAECESVDICVNQLMKRIGCSDFGSLIQEAVANHEKMLSTCPYSGCLQGYPDLMRLRHLLWRSVPFECDTCSVTITPSGRAKTRHLNELLDIASKVPKKMSDGSELNAWSWLQQESNVDIFNKLWSLLGIDPSSHDADGVTKLFDEIKKDLLSLCSGTGSLPADCSGWALLQHMLPLLPALKNQPMIHNTLCHCRIDIPPTMSIFEEPISELWSVIFPSLQRTLPSQEITFQVESSCAMSMACTAALASMTLQDRVNKMPTLAVTITTSSYSGLGMRVVTSCDPDFVARKEELDAIIGAVASVMDGTSHESRRSLLLHGVPGLGKTLSATQALHSIQKDINKNAGRAHTSQGVRLDIVRGRGAGVVYEDLVALGRNLGSVIGVVSDSPPDIVLTALRCFFQESRYVLLIDDADQEGLARALEYLPVSHQRCALIITSQSLTRDDVIQRLVAAGDNADLYFHKELQLFTLKECNELVAQVCEKCEALLAKQDDLRTVFDEGLERLPLAIRLFAEWSRVQFNANMQLHAESMRDKLQAALKSAKEAAVATKQPYDEEQAKKQFRLSYDADTGHYTAAASALLEQWTNMKNSIVLLPNAKYSRGLLGTVRLIRMRLNCLPPDTKEAIEQLLGLLTLCPTSKVPMSLFHGGSKREAQQLVRGARVEVSGESLEFVSSVGERCRVTKLNSGKAAPKPRYAKVVDQTVENGKVSVEYYEGNVVKMVKVKDLEFGPHIRSVKCKDDQLVLQLQKPMLEKGAQVIISNHSESGMIGREAFINHSFIVWDPNSDAADNRNVSIMFADTKEETLMNLEYLQLPDGVAIIDNQLVYPALAQTVPPSNVSGLGRVMQLHAGDGTVSVVFGCETGPLSTLKPGAEEKRFKVSDVRVRHVEGMAVALQDIEGLEQVARELKSSGLVHVDEGKRTFGMHQLLQQAVQDAMDLDWESQCKRMQSLMHARFGHFSDEHFLDADMFSVMRELLPTAVNVVERLKERLKEEKGGKLLDMWRIEMLLRLTDLAKIVHGEQTDFPGHIGSLVQVGIDKQGGVFAAAGSSHMRALNWSLQLVREESINKLRDEIYMLYQEADGDCKWEFGVLLHQAFVLEAWWTDPSDKIHMYQSALDMSLRTLGERHPYTAAQFSSLGACFGNDTDQHHKAIEFYEIALRIKKDISVRHPDTAFSMSSLSSSFSKTGRAEEAIELCKQALFIYDATVGRLHRYAADTLYNMGCAYCRLGNLSKAEELLSEVVEIHSKTLCPNNKFAQDGRQMLTEIKRLIAQRGAEELWIMGTSYIRERRAEDAIELFEKALRLYRRLGMDFSNAAHIMYNLGAAHRIVGNLETGEQLQLQAMQLNPNLLTMRCTPAAVDNSGEADQQGGQGAAAAQQLQPLAAKRCNVVSFIRPR